MCGIAGILNLSEVGVGPEEWELRGMLGAIRHRGPDQFGIYLGDGVAMGNARLSIVDLGGGQQPISNEDGSVWVVFNGEIFNHVELRAELERRGHRLSTHCDTEVLVHLWEDEGPRMLDRLNGQWALSIWDERKRSLFIARDRLGVRPLFYTQVGRRLVFGSEMKSIFAVSEISRELDPVGLDQVFTYWSAQAPRTCFRGVWELPAGCWMEVRGGEVRMERWWAYRPGGAPGWGREERREGGGEMEDGILDRGYRAGSGKSRSEGELVEELRELLSDAVRIRLRADVPVGAYLSGGLDSSTIAALVRELGVSHLDTFSIAFSDPQFDESEHQRRMAQYLGTDHQVVYATHEDIGSVFPDVVWHVESALMRTAPAPMFLLSRLVRQQDYKVVLTGEAADEMLAGYDIFKEARVRRFWARQPDSKWRPSLLRRLYPDITDLQSAGGAMLRGFFANGLTDTDDPYYSHAIRWRNTGRCRRLLVRREERGEGRWETGAGVPEGFGGWGDLEKAQWVEVQTFLSTYLLSSQGDRMGMANSVEGRFPFLDYRVVEFCSRLPSRMKLRVLRDKHLLREMAKGLVPSEISSRPKRPYRAPIQKSFLNARCRDWVGELLSEAGLHRAGLFQPAAVRQLVLKAESGRALSETDNMALVGVISGQLLHHRFVESFCPGRALDEGDDVKVVRRR